MSVLKKTLLIVVPATALAVGLFAWTQGTSDNADAQGGSWRVSVVGSFPHDTGAYTQGLAIHEGRLYEGTGQYGRSSIRRVAIETGRVEQRSALPPTYFGEGIAILDDRLYQLTWKSQVGFVYDVDSFDLVESFRYEGEGWGLSHDGEHLLVSDGTASIRFLDPETFEMVREIRVRDGTEAVARINELEFIHGEIWANVWFDDRVVRISPEDGQVLGWIDLSQLYARGLRQTDEVLNGIAFDPDSDRLFVTGKNWPRLFELELLR